MSNSVVHLTQYVKYTLQYCSYNFWNRHCYYCQYFFRSGCFIEDGLSFTEAFKMRINVTEAIAINTLDFRDMLK